MSEFYRCSICGNPMFAGYLCPKCSVNGLKSCEVKTTNWQEQKTIAELQKRIDELEAENKALRLIAGSHSMSELRRNRIMAGDKWFKYPPAPERKEQ